MIPLSPEWVAQAVSNVIVRFTDEMERAPTRREVEMIVSAVIRHGLGKDAPTTRLQ
jgi:hypothetical protein